MELVGDERGEGVDGAHSHESRSHRSASCLFFLFEHYIVEIWRKFEYCTTFFLCVFEPMVLPHVWDGGFVDWTIILS